MNIVAGNITNVEFNNSNLDESSIMEVKVKNLFFNNISFIASEIFKTNLVGMDFKTTRIEGLTIDFSSLKGIRVDMYQALELSKLLGIIVD